MRLQGTLKSRPSSRVTRDRWGSGVCACMCACSTRGVIQGHWSLEEDTPSVGETAAHWAGQHLMGRGWAETAEGLGTPTGGPASRTKWEPGAGVKRQFPGPAGPRGGAGAGVPAGRHQTTGLAPSLHQAARFGHLRNSAATTFSQPSLLDLSAALRVEGCGDTVGTSWTLGRKLGDSPEQGTGQQERFSPCDLSPYPGWSRPAPASLPLGQKRL